MRSPAFSLTVFAALAVAARGAEAPATNAVPRVLVAQPFAVEAGAASKLRLRGLNLTNASGARLVGPGSNAPVTIRARGDAARIDGFEPARVGDQRLEVEFALPAGTAPGTNTALVVTGPGGTSAPFPLWVGAAGTVQGEKEPNNGFREAPGAPLPLALRGALESAGDVDVFRIRLDSGATLHAEVFADRFGSTLDAMLTLHSASGAVLASNDDAAGRDPSLDYTAKETADCFVAVSYANEKAAPTHEYLLELRAK